MSASVHRSRWAAIGAAIVVALGAGGLSVASAVVPPPAANPVTTLIAPCRLMDTRVGGVGPRSTPLGPGETYTATVWGNCTVPNTATGIVANVTIVGPTGGSFLTVWPADKPRPNSSNLNWVAGQAPTANQVTTALSVADGRISLYNAGGTVNLIVDITGYLTPADLSNYYTRAQVDSANAAQNATVTTLQTTVGSLQTSMSGLQTTVSSLQSSLTALQANTYTKAQVDAAIGVAGTCKGYPHHGIDWHGCNLTDAYLVNQDLSGGTLTGITLTGAHLGGTVFSASALPFAYLDSVYASGAYFVNANMLGITLTGSFVDGADLDGANLSSANLTDATLTSSTLRGANLSGANLTGAFLGGADFTNANLSGATVDGSNYGSAIYSNTICPDGTNSSTHKGTCLGVV